ncbi:MAG: gamma-glutamylcyclotransferase [Alphaproteobacteria bacterium]
MVEDDSEFWVFGYGSLMWDPGFPHLEAVPALLSGYHRSFCIYSYQYRGTRERPGLVLGLKLGGSCRGMAFRVAPEEREATVAYLTEREMTSYVYNPMRLPVALSVVVRDHVVHAHTYVADHTHPNYAAGLTLEETAGLIRQGVGIRGPNRDYLENTVQHLEEIGVDEPELVALRDLVRRMGP